MDWKELFAERKFKLLVFVVVVLLISWAFEGALNYNLSCGPGPAERPPCTANTIQLYLFMTLLFPILLINEFLGNVMLPSPLVAGNITPYHLLVAIPSIVVWSWIVATGIDIASKRMLSKLRVSMRLSTGRRL